jgi:hypothetical protein
MNFHPEWGFLAPAPGLLRTVRTALVAMAVGATAGGGVALSLVDRSVGQTSVAERTLVRPMPAASMPLSAPQTVRLNVQTISQGESAEASQAGGGVKESATNEFKAGSPVGQAVIAASAEVPAATDDTSIKTTVVLTPAVRIRPKQVVERARPNGFVSASRQRRHSLAPQTTPNAIQRFLTGLTAVFEGGQASPRLPAGRTSRVHGYNPSATISRSPAMRLSNHFSTRPHRYSA